MNAPTPITPARLAWTAEGIPWSEAYGDVYHSADGGLGQARHVFLGGNGLPTAWAGRECFVIVETGFGLGLNFLATWQAWRDDPARPARLHFVSVEKHPYSAADLAQLHARWPVLAPLSAMLRENWPVPVSGAHRLHFEAGRVTLTLLLGDARHLLPRVEAAADAFYLDGFAPSTNPDLWSDEVFRALARLARPGATLATYTVAAAVREGLSRRGFTVERREGFGRKREMLSACFTRHAGAHRAPPAERRAAVIGAGLAGSSIAERLADRGWDVTVIERHEGPAREASGNLAGVLRPMLAKDDSRASRFSRACFLYGLRQLAALEGEHLGLRRGACGALQMAKNDANETLQQEILAAHRFPAEFVRFTRREEAAALAGAPVAAGGLWFPAAGWANPPSLCAALLARHPARLRTLFSRGAVGIERTAGAWIVRDGAGTVLTETPLLILANAAQARQFAPAATLPLKAVRGQVTLIPAGRLGPLRAVLSREGYVSPAVDGLHCLGATFEFDDPGTDLRASGHAANLARLERLLPGTSAGLDPAQLAGRVGFRPASPDRMPLVGALPAVTAAELGRETRLQQVPRWPGLYGVLGFGARGLVWSALAAELLACELEGEPMPLESDLMQSLDPARFALRAARRGPPRFLPDDGE